MITAKEAREMKTCSKCKEEKSYSLFDKHRGEKDGHCRICKLCRSAATKGINVNLEMPELPKDYFMLSLITELNQFSGYAINKQGEIISCLISNRWRIKCYSKKWRKLSTRVGKPQYEYIVLRNLGEERTVKIHRLLCSMFIPNPENKPCVNHKDGNKHNNSLDNLEWCTISENTIHAYAMGLMPKTRNRKKKFTV